MNLFPYRSALVNPLKDELQCPVYVRLSRMALVIPVLDVRRDLNLDRSSASRDMDVRRRVVAGVDLDDVAFPPKNLHESRL